MNTSKIIQVNALSPQASHSLLSSWGIFFRRGRLARGLCGLGSCSGGGSFGSSSSGGGGFLGLATLPLRSLLGFDLGNVSLSDARSDTSQE
jgi:hypothetical protein